MFDPREIEPWFVEKDFSTDWTSGHFPNWCRVLEPLRQDVTRVLEIGSWEGRSAIFFLEFFSKSSIVCIDPFHTGGSSKNSALSLAEGRFDKNTQAYGDRVTKTVSESVIALHKLEKAGEKFDLIYIDGSHDRDDVIIDSLLAWRLSHVGTVIIWDDYGGGSPEQPPETLVKVAIDLFLALHINHFSILHRGYQIIAQRVA